MTPYQKWKIKTIVTLIYVVQLIQCIINDIGGNDATALFAYK